MEYFACVIPGLQDPDTMTRVNGAIRVIGLTRMTRVIRVFRVKKVTRVIRKRYPPSYLNAGVIRISKI